MKRRFILFLSFLSVLLLIIPINNVYADSTYLISDFDRFITGETDGFGNGNNSLFDIDRISGTFEVSSITCVSDYNCIYMLSGKGYLNLTQSFNYISQINFSIRPNNAVGKHFYIYFQDEDDNNLLKILFDTDENFRWFDDSGDETIYNAENTWYYITITHLYTNWFNVSIFDHSTNTLLGYDDVCSYIAETWYTFDHILIDGDTTGVDGLCYIDNFYITTSSNDDEYDYCENSYYKIDKKFDDSIMYMNETVSFGTTCYLGLFGNYAIFNSEDDVVQSGSISNYKDTVLYTSKTVDGFGTFYIKVRLNGQSTWYLECPFTVLEESADDEQELPVGEWYIGTDKTQYEVLEFPEMYYKIPDGQIGNVYIRYTDSSEWEFLVSLEGDGNLHHRTMFPESEENCRIMRLTNYTNVTKTFSNSFCFVDNQGFNINSLRVNGGQVAYIECYDEIDVGYDVRGNTLGTIYLNFYDTFNVGSITIPVKSISLGSSNWLWGHEIFDWNINKSVGRETFYGFLTDGNTIFNSTYIKLYVDDYVEESEDSGEDNAFGMTNEGFEILIGFALAFGIAGVFSIYTGVTGFLGILGSCLFLFSRPEIAPYNYLPVEIGYALIGMLAVIGFIVWKS